MKKLLHKLPMHVYHLDICVEILVDYEVLQTSPFTAFWKLPTQNCQFYLQKLLKGFEHYIAKTGYRCQSKSKAIAQRTLVQWQQAESSYLSGQQNGKVKTKCQKAIFIEPLPKHKFRSEEKKTSEVGARIPRRLSMN